MTIEIIMRKYKKYILITLFSLLMLFGFGKCVMVQAAPFDTGLQYEGKADWEILQDKVEGFNCGPEVEGYKRALFVLSESDETVYLPDELDDEKYIVEPTTGDIHCVLIANNRTDVVFDEFVDAGIFRNELADNEYSIQEYGKGSILFLSRWSDFWFDDYASTMVVKLKKTGDSEDAGRIRYRIQRDASVSSNYLYFMGFSNPNATGLINALPKEKCWELGKIKDDCDKKYPDQCFWYPIANKHDCQSRLDADICSYLPINYCGVGSLGSQACVWNTVKNECLSILNESVEQAYPVPTGYSGPMPPCAFSGSCHDTNDIVQLVVNFVANILLPFVGGAVFIMFVYGGFTIILSFGNPEKVKKGWGILIAALVGMGIVFGAYLLLDFVFTSLNISAGFRGFGR